MFTSHKGAFYALGLATLIAGASSCTKDNTTPKPVEQELITTLKLTFLGDSVGTMPQTFVYKVENGFNSTTAGSVRVDTLKLRANRTYTVTVDVYNEKANPVDTITYEIEEENNKHLFYYTSSPTSGAGSITPVAGTGNLDAAGKPFNRVLKMATGAAGNGSLRVTLIHEPTDKMATTRAVIGGETDAEGSFPVQIQ